MTNNTSQRSLPISLKLLLLFAHILGAFIALIGVVVILIGLYHTTIFLVANAWSPIFLFVLPAVTLVLAAGVIFLTQPVHNLLCLISVFFSTVLLYLYVGAEFLAFLFLIVYVGAIAILFLFVIMLLHLKPSTSGTSMITSGAGWLLYPTALLTVFGLEDILASSLSSFFITTDNIVFKTAVVFSDALVWFVNGRFTDILSFSHLLYTYHCFLFFLSALLLLTAMLGAIILATSATDSDESTGTL